MPVIKLIPGEYDLIDEHDPEVKLSKFAKKGSAKKEDTDYFVDNYSKFAPGYQFEGYGQRRVMRLRVCHDHPNGPKFEYSYCQMAIGKDSSGKLKELKEPGDHGILYCGLGQVPTGGPAVFKAPREFHEKFYPNGCGTLKDTTESLYAFLNSENSGNNTLNVDSREALEDRLIIHGFRLDELMTAGKLTFIFEELRLVEPGEEVINQIVSNE